MWTQRHTQWRLFPRETHCSLRRRMDGWMDDVALLEERFVREDRSLAEQEMSFLLSWRTAASRWRTAELMQHIIIPVREAHYKNSTPHTRDCHALHTIGQHFSATIASGPIHFLSDIPQKHNQNSLLCKGKQNALHCIDAMSIFVVDVQPNYFGTFIECKRRYFECG